MSAKCTTEIDIIEKNGKGCVGELLKMHVHSAYPWTREMVVLEFEGNRVVVLAKDLSTAIENATNCSSI